MTATLDDVAKKEPAEVTAEQQAATELARMAKDQGLSLTGPAGQLKQLTKSVIETALDEEMTEHLGYARHDRVGIGAANIHNGTRHARPWAWAAAVVATAVALSACGTQACTAVGCSSGISVTAPLVVDGHTVSQLTICGIGSCETKRTTTLPSGAQARINVPTTALPSSHQVTVTVNVLDASGADLLNARGQITLGKVTPNGPKCGPICFFRAVVVSNNGTLTITTM